MAAAVRAALVRGIRARVRAERGALDASENHI